MDTREPSCEEIQTLLSLPEDHFNDLKSKKIAAAKLQESFVAFANSDGGDLYIRIEDEKIKVERIIGFNNQEEANPLLELLLEQTNLLKTCR